ncbi:uncharacterized protein EV422DRAFT_517563 [Fimicolochytrium jonesii]|uniref:uncharacterized protein n=1 Tax=Fimicolochytrium jonesii TaxID=1396493 RepID=UPI0022FF0E8D|nr:uncharacterized protein EV422DRAFT_517563 [Fimicolochytrium jonesii]KAI8825128.1 hypothetical protein EV422DRAFT_517563 [Fimicolochytrium jonesii]
MAHEECTRSCPRCCQTSVDEVSPTHPTTTKGNYRTRKHSIANDNGSTDSAKVHALTLEVDRLKAELDALKQQHEIIHVEHELLGILVHSSKQCMGICSFGDAEWTEEANEETRREGIDDAARGHVETPTEIELRTPYPTPTDLCFHYVNKAFVLGKFKTPDWPAYCQKWARKDFSYTPGAVQFWRNTYLTALNENTPQIFETPYSSDGVNQRFLQTHLDVIKEGRFKGCYFFICEDTTDLKKALDTVKVQNVKLDDALTMATAATVAKGRFLANMSHEIRTPLHGISSAIALLEDTTLTADQHDLITSIRICSDALLDLVSGVLDLAKIEAGKLTLDIDSKRPCDIRASVSECITVVSNKAKSKGLELRWHCEEDVPRFLFGIDAARWRQCILNLLGNGVKFTDVGGVAAEIRIQRNIAGDVPSQGMAQGPAMCTDSTKPLTRSNTSTSSAPSVATPSASSHSAPSTPTAVPDHPPTQIPAMLIARIIDTGVGMAPHVPPTLFTPFTQGSAETNTKFGGTGLGLAIAKNLAVMMGGDIKVESTEGVGSVFELSVLGYIDLVVEERENALRRADQHAGGTRPRTPSPSKWIMRCRESAVDLGDDAMDILSADQPLVQQKQQLRVLLVEDNPLNQKLATRMLIKAGAHVTTASDGIEAVKCFQQGWTPSDSTKSKDGGWHPFDVILMDLSMPKMGGVEATRLIRELEAGLQQKALEDTKHSTMATHSPRRASTLASTMRPISRTNTDDKRFADEVNYSHSKGNVTIVPSPPPSRDSHRRPHATRTRIMALTAHALSDVKQECLDNGLFDDFLSKPVKIDELLDCVFLA